VRVERPAHYDSFADFQYSYHYGDSYIPQIKHEEPLKAEMQHFLDSIANDTQPLTSGYEGLEMVKILEAASRSLKNNGAPVTFARAHEKLPSTNGVHTNGSLHSGIEKLVDSPLVDYPQIGVDPKPGRNGHALNTIPNSSIAA
jgi:hypothetical protein